MDRRTNNDLQNITQKAKIQAWTQVLRHGVYPSISYGFIPQQTQGKEIGHSFTIVKKNQ